MKNNNQTKVICLCPPSYYGSQCQYQNQRISLTIQIRLSSNWYQRFIYFITLIDDEQNIIFILFIQLDRRI